MITDSNVTTSFVQQQIHTTLANIQYIFNGYYVY
jgi:hypothetical protein